MMKYAHLTVGVLDLQGAVSEHLTQIQSLGATPLAIKHTSQLTQCDALVLPGGESTAIGKLMREYGFIEEIRRFSAQNKPIFGTCAGMILLAKDIVQEKNAHLQLMDIQVQRNAFGRQIDSFQTEIAIKGFHSPFPAVFIRAPYINQLTSSAVEILAEYQGDIVLAKQQHLLACSFHPELTQDSRIMQLFLDMALT